MYYIGLDIGGTKCAVSLGCDAAGSSLEILDKVRFETGQRSPYAVLEEFLTELKAMLDRHGLAADAIESIGISCGGPLNSRTGVIQSPPNLPGWDNIPAAEFFQQATGIPTWLQNDANACAVAEWKFGAGRGKNSVIYLTFGTGFGAGLILDGRLYSGATDNAGEIGHVRLTPDGPVGYYKKGSAEGWCSGGGLAQIGRMAVEKELAKGNSPLLLERAGGDCANISAKLIAELAKEENDPVCLEIYRTCGQKLGAAISILIDLIDPEQIIIGGVFMRSADLLIGEMQRVIGEEALHGCEIVPAGLGENVGDYAALSIASLHPRNRSTEK